MNMTRRHAQTTRSGTSRESVLPPWPCSTSTTTGGGWSRPTSPASDGTLTVPVTGLNEGLLAEQVTSTRTGHINALDLDVSGQLGLEVSATLARADGRIAPREFRIGAPAS